MNFQNPTSQWNSALRDATRFEPDVLNPALLGEQFEQESSRNVQRTLKSWDFVTQADPECGTTPKELVHQRGPMRLYHYLATTDEVYRTPLLLAMSLVSKPYILDLSPEQSFVRYLVDEGFDVYLIDWGEPGDEDRHLGLNDYTMDLLPECIDHVLADSGETALSLFGYCLGGTLAAMYTAASGDARVRNLGCIAAPIDFDEMGLFKTWTDERFFNVDRVVDQLGNAPAELLLHSFNMLRPASKLADPVRLWDNIWNDEFVTSYRRVTKWSNDQVPIAGECFRDLIKDLLQANRLHRGAMSLGNTEVDLASIDCPVLQILAEHDHIVPPACGGSLVDLVSSEDKQAITLKGGHASLIAGRNATKRLWPSTNEWLSLRSM